MVRYMPRPACELAYSWLRQHPAKLKIAKPRATKLGDFRVTAPGAIPIISVNGDLNPFAFSITLAHEVAHHRDFAARGRLATPHGASWKNHYTNLLGAQLQAGVFPAELVPVITRHLSNPKAASCSDVALMRALTEFDSAPKTILAELPFQAHFKLGNRLFQKGELRRTRVVCSEIGSGRKFLVHSLAEIEPLA